MCTRQEPLTCLWTVAPPPHLCFPSASRAYAVPSLPLLRNPSPSPPQLCPSALLSLHSSLIQALRTRMEFELRRTTSPWKSGRCGRELQADQCFRIFEVWLGARDRYSSVWTRTRSLRPGKPVLLGRVDSLHLTKLPAPHKARCCTFKYF